MLRLTEFAAIPQFAHCDYTITVPWTYIERFLKTAQEHTLCPLNLNPDFQREHVWTATQQTKYLEYQLRGGISGRHIYANCKGWHRTYQGPYELVDGKQRIQAILQFLRGQLPVFGSYYSEFTDRPSTSSHYIIWNVAALETRAEVLQWYIDLNTRGTPHLRDEIMRVQKLLEAEK